HSRTSSTSRTGKQKRSRPLRKTQYCDSAARSSRGPMASNISAVSASGGRGASWNSSVIGLCETPNGAKQFVLRKGFGHVGICALLLAPIFVAAGILGSDEDYWDALELLAAL